MVSFFVATGFPLPETHSQLAAEKIGALGKAPLPFLGRFKHFIFCRVAICFFCFESMTWFGKSCGLSKPSGRKLFVSSWGGQWHLLVPVPHHDTHPFRVSFFS